MHISLNNNILLLSEIKFYEQTKTNCYTRKDRKKFIQN